jgi:N6-adenosine-specific RNA methylase IME4
VRGVCLQVLSRDAVKYRTIVADPPWALDMPRHIATRANKGEGREPVPYPTLSVGEIANLPVRDLAEKDAHLYLWTINAYLEDAYRVARAWGFKPSTLLTWCKRPNGLGLGGTYSLTTEYALFCRRGSCAASTRIDTTWFEWPRGPHSRKPDAFLDLVEQVSPGPYLEMFARRCRLGWDAWGDQWYPGVEIA